MPGLLAELGAALGHDVAPGGHIGRQAQPQETQNRFGQHRRRRHKRALHQERCHGVGQDVPPQNNRCGRGQCTGRFHIRLFAQREHQGAHQPRDTRHLGYGDGDDHRGHIRTQRRHQGDGQQHSRDGHQAVHEAHQHHVHLAKVTGQHAAQTTQAQRQQSGGDTDQQRNAPAKQDPAVDIAAKAVGAQPKSVGHHAAIGQSKLACQAQRFVDVVGVHGGRVHRAQPRREHGQQQHQAQHGRAKTHRAMDPQAMRERGHQWRILGSSHK